MTRWQMIKALAAVGALLAGDLAAAAVCTPSSVPWGTDSFFVNFWIRQDAGGADPGAPLTGIDHGDANLQLFVWANASGTTSPTTYTVTGTDLIQGISTLHTWAAPSSGQVRLGENGSTGYYEVQLENSVLEVAGATSITLGWRDNGSALNMLADSCTINLRPPAVQPIVRTVDIHRDSTSVITLRMPTIYQLGDSSRPVNVTSTYSGLTLTLDDGGNQTVFDGSDLETIPTVIGAVVSDDGGSRTDDTTDCNDADANDCPIAGTLTNNDAIMLGDPASSNGVVVNVGTAGVGSYTIDGYEYLTDDSPETWAPLTGVVDNTNMFKTSGVNDITWDRPTNCVGATFASQAESCWVRFVIDGGTTGTDPLITQISRIAGKHYMAPTTTAKARVGACGLTNCVYLADDYYESPSQYFTLTMDDAAGNKTLAPSVAMVFLDGADAEDIADLVESGVDQSVDNAVIPGLAQFQGLVTQITSVQTGQSDIRDAQYATVMQEATVTSVSVGPPLVLTLSVSIGAADWYNDRPVCVRDVSVVGVRTVDCAWATDSTTNTVTLDRALKFTPAATDEVYIGTELRGF